MPTESPITAPPANLGHHQAAYDAVFQHPVAHNLQWRDLRAMLEAISDSTDEQPKHVKFTRNGQTLIVHPPQHKDFDDVEQLVKVRHFIERSGKAAGQASSPTPADATHLLVVIDHREARIYRSELHGTTPERIAPFDPHGLGRHLHQVEEGNTGQRKPEPKAFYEAVAKTLRGAHQILILGSATGASSAMDHLVAELKAKHPEIAANIVGTVVVNEQHMSDDQLLAHARKFYAAKPATNA